MLLSFQIILGDTSPCQTLWQHCRSAVRRRSGCVHPQSHRNVQQREGIRPIPSRMWMHRPCKVWWWDFLCYGSISRIIFKGWIEQKNKSQLLSNQTLVGLEMRASCWPMSSVTALPCQSPPCCPVCAHVASAPRRVPEMLAVELLRKDWSQVEWVDPRRRSRWWPVMGVPCKAYWFHRWVLGWSSALQERCFKEACGSGLWCDCCARLLVNTVGGVDHADVTFPNHHMPRQLS